jgi:MFS family permease
LDPTNSRFLLPLLFTGVLMGALDLAIIGPALPAIEAEFGMNSQQLSVLFNAYVLCQMIGTPLLAKAGDRAGPRQAYVFSIALFALGSLLLVIATTPQMLYWGRAVQGFGAGGIFPIAAAVIGNTLPAKERGPALGILGTVFGLAFIIGPVMGGVLLPFGWHWLFAINLPIAAVLAAGALWLLPAKGAATRKPVDSAGIILLATLLTALVVGIDQLDTTAVLASLRTWPVAGPLVLAAVLVPVFWRVEQRAVDPIIRPGLLRSRPIITASVIGAGVGAIQAAGAFYPALAVAAVGVSQSGAAWLQLPGVLVATVASPVAGRLINTVGVRMLVTVGLALAAVSVLIFGLATLTIPVFIAASMLGSMGLGGVLGAPLRVVILDHSQPAERGAAQGLLSNFTSAGRLLGAAFVGTLAATAGGGTVGYQAAFVGVAVIAAAMAALGLLLKPAQPARDGRPA